MPAGVIKHVHGNTKEKQLNTLFGLNIVSVKNVTFCICNCAVLLIKCLQTLDHNYSYVCYTVPCIHQIMYVHRIYQ